MNATAGRSTDTGTATPLSPIAWRVVGPIAAVTAIFHLATTDIAGMHRDEFYYLVGGHHPAFGYVDHPPLVPLLYRASESAFGHTQFALHVLPSVIGGGFVILAAYLAREFGGNKLAQGLAATMGALGPIFVTTSRFLSTVTIDLIAWSLASLIVLRIIRTGNERLWLLLGVVIGVGMMNKHSMLFWVAGAFVGLLATPERRILRSWFVLGGAAIALAITAPNVVWQIDHHWPTVKFLHSLQDDAASNRSEYLGLQLAVVTFGGIAVWVTGLIATIRRGSPFAHARWLAIGWLFLLIAIFVLGGKGYYVGSWYLPLVGVGAVVIEDQWSRRAQLAVLIAVIITGIAFVPLFTPVFSPSTIHDLGLDDANKDLGGMLGWHHIEQQIAGVVHGLPRNERNNAVILTGDYSEAGALDFWRKDDQLPRAYSGHNTYWYWGRPHGRNRTVVAVGIGPEAAPQVLVRLQTGGHARARRRADRPAGARRPDRCVP